MTGCHGGPEAGLREMGLTSTSRRLRWTYLPGEMRREEELGEIRAYLQAPQLEGDNVLMIIHIRTIYGHRRDETTITSFLDIGSSCSVILTEVAEWLGLEGLGVTITIGTANGRRTRNTKLYGVELLTRECDRKMIRAFGVERISDAPPFIGTDGAKRLFSREVQEVWDEVVGRPRKPIELLIGADKAGLLPQIMEKQGNLIVLKSDFGTGYVMFGNHPKLEITTFPAPAIPWI